MVICLERGADLHMAQLMPLPLAVSCFSKIQIGFTFLVLAHPGSPVQRAVKRLCVSVVSIVLPVHKYAVFDAGIAETFHVVSALDLLCVFLGFTFDLRQLTKTNDSYLVFSNSTDHNYYINVCEDTVNTACINDTARHIGVCQAERSK